MSEQFSGGEMISIQQVHGSDGSIGTLHGQQLVAPACSQSNSGFSFDSQFQEDVLSFPVFWLLTSKYLNSSWTYMKWDPYSFKDLTWKLNHSKVKIMMRESFQREIRPFTCLILMCFLCMYLEILFCVTLPSGKPLTPDHTFFLDCFLLCWELLVFWDRISKEFKNWYVSIHTSSYQRPDTNFTFGFAGHKFSATQLFISSIVARRQP